MSREKRHFLATQSCLTRSMLTTFCFGTDETRVCNLLSFIILLKERKGDLGSGRSGTPIRGNVFVIFNY